ncbi:MAG: MFS transporter [Rhodoferax sp.]|nr:MFS transporter [Rhodoferax sp.]MBP9931667.1 MFS transporter [Rhodoferax sp.]HQX60839.1 MFS transporter [Burkholderiaceae bacterium]HQZ06949.1 MFS transporter [Burkholderiaceae bacterium]HRA63998.1 MFS transporter [Burkholderiaceae bacterium]
MTLSRGTSLLLNLGHALDHMFLLIFATAVASVAADFGFVRWEDLMPYSAGAFLMFGLGSVPAGRLGDLWGRRSMMLIFFFGMGAAALLCALVQNAWQMAIALALLGLFSAIYHPVGIPMLLQHARKPGLTIGVNGLAGNMGIALAAIVTGFTVKYLGWRAAFIFPGLLSMVCGYLFLRLAPPETESPARRTSRATVGLAPAQMARLLSVMTFAAISSSLLFNFTTNGNGQLMRERFVGIVDDPAQLGMLLAAVYAIASFSQLIVGRLIDRFALKRLYLAIVLLQIPMFLLAAHAQGWTLFWLQIGFMVTIFGAIPFTDAMVVRYVDDAYRSRVSGMRLAVSFGVASVAVYSLGPTVKAAGFDNLLLAMAAIACCSLVFVSLLPGDPVPVAPPAPA